MAHYEKGGTCLLTYGIASRRMLRERSFRFSLQGVQLGHGRSCSYQADQARRPPKERAADDRGTEGSRLARKNPDIEFLGRNRPS
jgi:hypothetical protein